MTSRPMLATSAAAFALLAMGADDCGTETKDTADKDPKSDAQKPSKEKKARVGDVITLEGNEDGSKVAVRLVGITDPVAAGEFQEPASGSRYVGVKLRLSNQGTITYADAPSNGATLVVTGDEQAESTLLADGPCGGQFSSSAKVSPGTKLSGCLPFEVPTGKRPVRFQFTLDSGFGPATGEWTIRP